MKQALVVTTLLFGFLAAIIVPNMRKAAARSHQERTMADVRSIATAWEARATDFNTYAVTPSRSPDMASVSLRDMRRALVPTYIRVLPGRDGWDRPFQFATNGQNYFVRSAGADGKVDHFIGATTSYDNDLVYSNGSFIEYPELS